MSRSARPSRRATHRSFRERWGRLLPSSAWRTSWARACPALESRSSLWPRVDRGDRCRGAAMARARRLSCLSPVDGVWAHSPGLAAACRRPASRASRGVSTARQGRSYGLKRRRRGTTRVRSPRQPALAHSARSNDRGSSTTHETVSKRIVARRSRSYRGQPGSPVAAKATQARCMASASACGGSLPSSGPSIWAGPRSSVSKTNGISSAWHGAERVRRTPARARRTRTCRSPDRARAWASARRMAGIRHHQSVWTAASSSPGTCARVRGAIGGERVVDRQPVGAPATRYP